MMRAVLDTNILVSALLKPSGPPGNLLQCLRNGSFIVVFSPALLDEIAAVMMSPKIRIKYGLTRRDVETVFSLFALRGEIAEGTEKIRICRDPEDDFLIEAAAAGRADYLVTGTKTFSP